MIGTSEKVENTLVSIIAEKINHTLWMISGCCKIKMVQYVAYLGHDCLAILAFHIFEWHLHALSCGDLDARTVNVGNLSQGNYRIEVSEMIEI